MAQPRRSKRLSLARGSPVAVSPDARRVRPVAPRTQRNPEKQGKQGKQGRGKRYYFSAPAACEPDGRDLRARARKRRRSGDRDDGADASGGGEERVGGRGAGRGARRTPKCARTGERATPPPQGPIPPWLASKDWPSPPARTRVPARRTHTTESECSADITYLWTSDEDCAGCASDSALGSEYGEAAAGAAGEEHAGAAEVPSTPPGAHCGAPPVRRSGRGGAPVSLAPPLARRAPPSPAEESEDAFWGRGAGGGAEGVASPTGRHRSSPAPLAACRGNMLQRLRQAARPAPEAAAEGEPAGSRVGSASKEDDLAAASAALTPSPAPAAGASAELAKIADAGHVRRWTRGMAVAARSEGVSEWEAWVRDPLAATRTTVRHARGMQDLLHDLFCSVDIAQASEDVSAVRDIADVQYGPSTDDILGSLARAYWSSGPELSAPSGPAWRDFRPAAWL